MRGVWIWGWQASEPFWHPNGQSLGRKAAPFVDSRDSAPNLPENDSASSWCEHKSGQSLEHKSPSQNGQWTNFVCHEVVWCSIPLNKIEWWCNYNKPVWCFMQVTLSIFKYLFLYTHHVQLVQVHMSYFQSIGWIVNPFLVCIKQQKSFVSPRKVWESKTTERHTVFVFVVHYVFKGHFWPSTTETVFLLRFLLFTYTCIQPWVVCGPTTILGIGIFRWGLAVGIPVESISTTGADPEMLLRVGGSRPGDG